MSGADVAGGIGVSTAASAKNAIRPGLDGVTRRDRDRVLGCLDGVPGSPEGLEVVQEHEKEEHVLQEKESGRIKRENGVVGPVTGERWVVLEAKGQEKQQQHQRQEQHQQPLGPQLEHGVSQGERPRKEKQQKCEIISTAGKAKNLKEEREQQRWQQEENDEKLQQQEEELVLQQNHQQQLQQQQQQQQQQPNMTARSSEKEMDEEQWLGQGQDHREECLDTSVGTKCQALQAGRNDKRSWEKRPKPSDTAIKSCQQKDHHELGRMSGELDVDILGSDHVRQKGVVEDEGRREHEAASGGPKEEVAVFATEHRVEEPKHKTNQATTGSNIITHTNDDDGKDRDNEQLWREEQTCVARSRGAPVRPGAGLKVGSGEQHERGAKEGSVMLDMGHGKEEGEHGDEDRQEHAIADEDEKTEGEEDTSVPELVRIRRRNIARNEAMLAALSLPQPKARASLRGKRKSAKAGARKAAGSAVPAPLRKSKRLRGEKVDSEGLLALPGTRKSCIMGNDRVSGAESRGANLTAGVDDSRIKLQVLDVEHASEKMKELDKAIRDRDESKAGTASYRHCLHRVQTMGDVRLVRRVRAIERARGKKAARKMLVFVNVLRDKSKGEVLAVAEAALDRLLRGIPMPETS